MTASEILWARSALAGGRTSLTPIIGADWSPSKLGGSLTGNFHEASKYQRPLTASKETS